jgi:hypothetical protein
MVTIWLRILRQPPAFVNPRLVAGLAGPPVAPLAQSSTGVRFERVCHSRPSLLIVASVALGVARAAAAQAPPFTITPVSPETPRWVGHFTVLAGNATIGALTGGVLQKLKGGSFKDGFVRGALGGTVIYAGKRAAAQDFWGAGLLGREINAVGVSMVRNASDGEATFSRLYLPLGPLPLRAALGLQNGVHLQPQLDLSAAAWLTYGLVESRLSMDVTRSVSSGAAVFQADRRRILDAGTTLGGFAVARSIFLSDPLALPGAGDWDGVVAHERVHVLQQDFVLTAWSQPLAEFALGRVAPGRVLNRYAAVDVLDWVVGAVASIFTSSRRWDGFPTELEAEFLSGR